MNSWAGTFYQEVFCRIDEKIFVLLYSEKDSRPNVQVNVLVALEILKSGYGWSDEELYEQALYNLQIRLALGLHNLTEDIFTERTIYNFRKRVREYARETGINLMQKVFEQITDAQLEELSLIQRVLEEQYRREPEGTLQLRPRKEIETNCMQSPHDPEATYRVKGGKEFRGGYVVNISETADAENPIQLITDVQVEPNQTDDTVLMEQSLDDQSERDIEVEKVTTDGGYTGSRGENACEKHNVELTATRMRGGI